MKMAPSNRPGQPTWCKIDARFFSFCGEPLFWCARRRSITRLDAHGRGYWTPIDRNRGSSSHPGQRPLHRWWLTLEGYRASWLDEPTSNSFPVWLMLLSLFWSFIEWTKHSHLFYGSCDCCLLFFGFRLGMSLGESFIFCLVVQVHLVCKWDEMMHSTQRRDVCRAGRNQWRLIYRIAIGLTTYLELIFVFVFCCLCLVDLLIYFDVIFDLGLSRIEVWEGRLIRSRILGSGLDCIGLHLIGSDRIRLAQSVFNP